MYSQIQLSKLEKNISIFLPYLLFFSNAVLTAMGAYELNYNEESPNSALILAGIIIGIGIAVCGVSIRFSYTCKIIKSVRIELLYSLILILYLAISTAFSFSYLSINTAVNHEIDENTIVIDKIIEPEIINATIINDNVLTILNSVLGRINSEVEAQGNKGGCHDVCESLKVVYDSLTKLNNDLAVLYNKNKIKKMKLLLINILNSSSDNSINWRSKVSNYNNDFSELKNEINSIIAAPSPRDIFKQANESLKREEINLQQLHYPIGSISESALKEAKLELSSISMIITDSENKMVDIRKKPLTLMPISANFELLLKHINQSIEKFIVALFLDFLAIVIITCDIIAYRKSNWR